jgi:hypothetical protein
LEQTKEQNPQKAVKEEGLVAKDSKLNGIPHWSVLSLLSRANAGLSKSWHTGLFKKNNSFEAFCENLYLFVDFINLLD